MLKKIFDLIVSIITLLIVMTLMLSHCVYIYNKTVWKWDTDCMIEYVNNYYPYWEIYLINWEPHVDKRWLWCWQSQWSLYWCNFPNDIFNSVYCSTSLFWESLINKPR